MTVTVVMMISVPGLALELLSGINEVAFLCGLLLLKAEVESTFFRNCGVSIGPCTICDCVETERRSRARARH
jgi:hypothetical protein